ncbi:hypothetical protein [Candidatus Phytoplasma mali]|nr:hypothetical protein [Candidatus Phytoplasma mali]
MEFKSLSDLECEKLVENLINKKFNKNYLNYYFEDFETKKKKNIIAN